MINLTQKITLQSRWKKIYLVSKIFLYVISVLATFFVIYRILFPEISLDYSFGSINALKNTLFLMRTNLQDPIKSGSIKSTEKLFFNANPLGNFKDAKLNIMLEASSQLPKNALVKIHKSYSAFFYPIGAPLGFVNGSLLNLNGNYYIISNGKARHFLSGLALDQLGYSRSSFVRISQEDLKLNPPGEDILNANSFPDDTLIVIGNQYYQFENQQLIPFISDKAFLSRFEAAQAIPKNEDFLKSKTVSESFIGFADGTLASSDQSVFILTRGQSYPIADSATFVAMGFDWKNVIPLTPAEINAYKRQKQFTVNQSHLDGTLLYDKNKNKYFVIDNGQKRPLENQLAAKTYAKVPPVLVDSRSLEKSVSCSPTKASLTFHTYTCNLNLADISDLVGTDYQFETSFENDVKLQSINVVLYTQLNQPNLMTSLSLIKYRILNNLQQ